MSLSTGPHLPPIFLSPMFLSDSPFLRLYSKNLSQGWSQPDQPRR
jgi:hypothetical protein